MKDTPAGINPNLTTPNPNVVPNVAVQLPTLTPQPTYTEFVDDLGRDVPSPTTRLFPSDKGKAPISDES